MEFNYAQTATTGDYEMKSVQGDLSDFNSQQAQFELEQKQIQKVNAFKERIKEFEKVTTLEEAKNLAKKIMPISQEKNIFRIGNAKCTVINKADMFRICVDTDKEFISYDFS